MNKELAIKKDLITDKDNTLYKKIENLYKHYFELYLLKKVDLYKYDDELYESELDFGVANTSKIKTLSNLKEYMNLKYIYIINSFFIEKLDNEDLDYLKQKKEENIMIDEKSENLIERTFKDVIKSNYYKGNYTDEPYKISYNVLPVPSSFVSNDALVIKIFFGRNMKKYSDKEFIENMNKKGEVLKDICERIKNEIKDILDINCEVLVEKTF